MPEPDEKMAPLDQLIVAGGPASNAAVAFRHLGGEALLATALGFHHVSGLAEEELESWGVQVINLNPDHDFHLPLVTVMVQERTGERSILSRGAGGLHIEAERFDPTWLDGVDVLLVDGHLMELSIRAARRARSLGIPTVLDAGSWKPGMDELLPEIDHAVCAERFRAPGCESFEQVFGYLERAGVPHRAITRGPRPILYRGPDQRLEIEIPSVEAIDTLAAGDIFHGAYAHALAVEADTPGAPAPRALASAAEVAALSCTTFGPRAWMDRKTEEMPS